MKSIVVFYDNNSDYSNEKIFDSKSAKDLSLAWASSINADSIVTIQKQNSVYDLLEKICDACSENQADYVVFAYSDVPFYNKTVTEKLIKNHIEYHAEYTFADGYSFGLTPEIIDKGTLNILLGLCSKEDAPEKTAKVTKQFLFELLKKDINSFEIETLLAKNDWRLLRLNLDCELKESFLACKALYNAAKEKNIDVLNCDIEELNELASKCPEVLKTVPGFYNIQITDFYEKGCVYCPYEKEYERLHKTPCCKAQTSMDVSKFEALINKISKFSENAVISLSLWGEAFAHKDLLKMIDIILKNNGLSVFIETRVQDINSDFINGLKTIIQNTKEGSRKWPPVMIAVCLDAFTKETYSKLHGENCSFEKAMNIINLLEDALPGNVYPQFVRMNANEEELESFFRFWNEKTSPSKGQFIIQKYDDYSGLLSQEKTADLSPVDRNVCWHLRRDMNILTNGDVILCKEYVLENVIGNVFEEDLEVIWKKMDEILLNHINSEYKNKCEKCDEFYTYYF